MRQAEICRIEWTDVDMKKRTVTIRDRKDPRRKDGNHQLVALLNSTGYDAWQIILEQRIVTRGIGRLFPHHLRKIFDSPHRDILRRISQLVLAAPDIHRAWMDQEFIPVLESVRMPTTIYVSDPDVWIGFSEFLHRNPRVGSFWSHSVYLQALVTTVDLSAVRDTFAGHSVVFSSAVLYDLYFVFERELPPEQRPWLWRTELAKGTYWHLLPQLIRP
jgi:hypothetical protein